MKERYTVPEIELIRINALDIITESGIGCGAANDETPIIPFGESDEG